MIAARVGCSRSAVGEMIRKHRLTGSVADRNIPGRCRKTTARQDRLLVRKSLANRFKTAPQIKAEMPEFSTSTAQRRLSLRVWLAWKKGKKKAMSHTHTQEGSAGICKSPQRLDSF